MTPQQGKSAKVGNFLMISQLGKGEEVAYLLMTPKQGKSAKVGNFLMISQLGKELMWHTC
jgi:hypothetical protein